MHGLMIFKGHHAEDARMYKNDSKVKDFNGDDSVLMK